MFHDALDVSSTSWTRRCAIDSDWVGAGIVFMIGPGESGDEGRGRVLVVAEVGSIAGGSGRVSAVSISI